jgi:hypothetical protein
LLCPASADGIFSLIINDDDDDDDDDGHAIDPYIPMQ